MLQLNTFMTAIGTLLLAAMCFVGKETYSELRQTHDLVLKLQVQMVSHAEFDATVADLKIQQMDIRSRQSATDIEIEKLKRTVRTVTKVNP